MYKEILNKKQSLKEIVLENEALKAWLGSMALLIGVMLIPSKLTKVWSMKFIFWVGRVINVNKLENISHYIIKSKFLRKTKRGNETILSQICLNSNYFKKSIDIYTVEDENKVSLFRDVILLKEKNDIEKGVMLIKYSPAFEAFYFYFDIERIFKDYYIVLEPSWAGACDPGLLVFWRDSLNKNVIVQAIEHEDFKFIENLGGNFIPINLGSSDWVDQDVFNQEMNEDKFYDLVMVSNWGIHKKHKELFRALSKTRRKLTVLLIGYQSGNRTRIDIEREMKSFDLKHINFEIKENIPASEVARLLKKSKVYLLLSKKEGPNKAIIEAFTANVPAILYWKFVGGAQTRINKNTGILSSYEKLKDNIEFMVDSYHKYSPREWVLKNTGSRMATLKLNQLLENISKQNGEVWTHSIVEKVNVPNLKHKYPNDFKDLKSIYPLYKRQG